jgi:hypothetical protein
MGGTLRPSALAVLRLITNSNLVGCWTGRSAGLAPCRAGWARQRGAFMSRCVASSFIILLVRRIIRPQEGSS